MAVLSPKTGSVFLRNFDQGVVETMNGEVRLIAGQRNYFIDIPACTPVAVPVIFLNPEQVFEDKIYPSFTMSRSGAFPALQRWHSVGQLEYIADAVSGYSVVGGVTGPDFVEIKAQAIPFDITYDIACYARYEREAVPMIKHLLRVWQPYSKLRLVDSLGQNRVYSVYNENDVSDLAEVTSVAERVRGYLVSIRVEGELDINDPYTLETLISSQQNVGVL